MAKRVLTVLGARPQFVKAAALSRAFAGSRLVEEVRVHTGQHYDANMSDVFFRELCIPDCKYELGIGSGPHGAQTGRMMEALERVTVSEAPDCVLVYGDTNSTLAGALVAAKLSIPIAHVEAGLRSGDRSMPEEINRVVTDQLADVLFAPSPTARRNLLVEGIAADRVHVVGDVMLDALRYYEPLARSRCSFLREIGVEAGSYILATVHRAATVDRPERLESVFSALAAVADDVPCVIPIHPRTRRALEATGFTAPAGMVLIDPVGYLEMVVLEGSARLIVTDSGGVQKEAFFHRVPCLTLRSETEWVELVDAGWNTLCPPLSAAAIADGIRDALDRPVPMTAPALYGNGDACGRILAALAAHL